MRNAPALLTLFLFFAFRALFSQTASISGTVTDSLTGQPVPSVAVFIPSTTFGTSTNSEGKYTLNRLPPGDYKLAFRHMSYKPVLVPLTVAAGKQYLLNLQVTEAAKMIGEVTVAGKIPDWSWGYDLFKQYFLGDPYELKCVLQNPKALKFYYQGDILTAYSKEPLEIVNHYLSYKIMLMEE